MPKGYIDPESRARGNRCGLYKHGLSGTAEYNSWMLMKGRCHNKNHPRYPEWGGRGISVCAEWLNNPRAFIEYVGKKPTPAHSIDRIDNNKGYEPGNVRWASRQEQSANRPTFCHSIEIFGQTKTAIEWARISGVDRHTIVRRIKNGDKGETILRDSPKANRKSRAKSSY